MFNVVFRVLSRALANYTIDEITRLELFISFEEIYLQVGII